MTPPTKGTDEYKRVMMAQAIENTKARSRRPTDQLQAIAQWRNLPLTVGILVVIMAFGLGVASVVRSYYADLTQQIKTAIVNHDERHKAHSHLREEIRKQGQRTRELIEDLRSDLTGRKRRR